ncbi:MAG TPA: oligosaccharide flippase family protein, partial [Methanobacteriaceae archaeon]|nr:oligosaccharide flippase family protein [Methanobacteriaceae archaeon]
VIIKEYKYFVQKIILVGITNILVSLSPLILLPILSKNLGVQEYGVWNQFTVTLTLIPAIAALGLPYTLVRFFSASRNLDEIKEAFYTIATLIILGCGSIAILFLVFSGFISDILFSGNTFVTLILALTLFISGLILLSFDYFRTFDQMRTYSIFSFSQAFLTVLIVALFIFNGSDISGAVLGMLITQIIIFLGMYVLIIKQIGFTAPKFYNIKEYLNFGLPTIPSNISFWILDITDRYLIGILLSLSFVGYYSAGYLLGSIISILLSPFYTILLPILAQYHVDNEVFKIKSLLNHSIKFFLVVAIPSVFILTILSKPILTILSTPSIAENGYIITPIVAIGGLFFGVYGIISQIIVLERKTKITGNIWLFSIFINVLMDIVFGFYWGIVGIAMTTLIVYLFAMLLTIYYSFKFIRCNFYFGFLSKTIISSIVISLILIIIYPTEPLKIILSILASFIVYLIILWALRGIKMSEIILFKEVFQDIFMMIFKPLPKKNLRKKLSKFRKYKDKEKNGG